MPERRTVAVAAAALLTLGGASVGAQTPTPPAPAAVAFERVTFSEAVRRAIERHPSVGEAAQAILRSQALLDRSKSVFHPSLYGDVGLVHLDAARGFDGFETVPRTQTAFSATLSFAFLDAAGWAAKNSAADRVAISRISAEETRRQVAVAAAQAYLAVIAGRRQEEIAVRNLETSRALEDYAKARLDAGKGSRLNHVRSTQERAAAELQLELALLRVRQAQEALGVAVFTDAPLDADGEPDLQLAIPPASDAWLLERPDVRLSTSEFQASERVVNDAWKSWLPVGDFFFTPQYVTPKGGFEPAKTWRAVFQLRMPIYDATLGPDKRVKVTGLETARLRLDEVKVEARAERRLAEETVTRGERMVAASRVSSESAAEALSISRVAYEAGATSNIEVVQAQQSARNAEIALAVSEDRLRESRLDLLVALGQFP